MLTVGGKDLHFEQKRMDKCNILICTPGRLLQHMDENPLFDCSNMQVSRTVTVLSSRWSFNSFIREDLSSSLWHGAGGVSTEGFNNTGSMINN
jgi:hypothetical protein